MVTKLTPKMKRFIVMSLGGGAGVVETLKAFYLEYNITLSYQAITRYDPTRLSGSSLSPALRKLFFQARERAAAALHECELSHAAIRQRRLDDLYLQATAGHLMAGSGKEKKAAAGPDLKLAVAIITESRKNSELFDWDGEEDDEEAEAVKVPADAKKDAKAIEPEDKEVNAP